MKVRICCHASRRRRPAGRARFTTAARAVSSHGLVHLVPGDEAGDHGALGPIRSRCRHRTPHPRSRWPGWRICSRMAVSRERPMMVPSKAPGWLPAPSPAGWRNTPGARVRKRAASATKQRRYLSYCDGQTIDIDRVKGYRTGFRYALARGGWTPSGNWHGRMGR